MFLRSLRTHTHTVSRIGHAFLSKERILSRQEEVHSLFMLEMAFTASNLHSVLAFIPTIGNWPFVALVVAKGTNLCSQKCTNASFPFWCSAVERSSLPCRMHQDASAKLKANLGSSPGHHGDCAVAGFGLRESALPNFISFISKAG